MPTDTKQLDRLLGWLALYVLTLLAISAIAGKLAEAIPVVTNLVSGFAGAALAIMRIQGGADPVRPTDKDDDKP
jgi:hypothetical protein